MKRKTIFSWRPMLFLFVLLILFINPNLNNAYTEDQPKITAIAAGMKYSLALGNDGTVWAWGNNDFGQLGDGTNINRNTPVKVKNITNVIGIAGGESYSIALKKDGTVWVWGRENSTNNFSSIPKQIESLRNIVAINSGTSASIAINKDGKVWALGDIVDWNNERDAFLPVQSSEFSNIKNGACGFRFCLAVKNDGTIWEWGWDKAIRDPEAPGVKVYGKPHKLQDVDGNDMDNVSEICGYLGYFLALKKDGTVWEWEEKEGLPSKIKNIENVVSIGKGYDHSLAAKKDGSVWSWGINDKGQLGNGLKNINYNHVVRVKDLMNIVKVSCGEYHSIALRKDGTVWTWGLNDKGQLGDGTYQNKLRPVKVIFGRQNKEIGDKTVITDIAKWRHPTKAIFNKYGFTVLKIELFENNTYPVFHVKTDLSQNIYNQQMLIELAEKNGFWSFKLIDGQDYVEVYCDKNQKKIINMISGKV